MKLLKLIKSICIFSLLTQLSVTSWAVPSEIILVRHGDKLLQKKPGPTLSAKGEIRAIALAFYILDKFGEPDVLIASNVDSSSGDESSLRELETISPLANMLQARHPEKTIPIVHPYADNRAMAHLILKDKHFNGKHLIICWDHVKIPALAAKLGVKQKLSAWPHNDFDSVYIIKYGKEGKVTSFEILNNQYPVNFNGSWQELYKKITE